MDVTGTLALAKLGSTAIPFDINGPRVVVPHRTIQSLPTGMIAQRVQDSWDLHLKEKPQRSTGASHLLVRGSDENRNSGALYHKR